MLGTPVGATEEILKDVDGRLLFKSATTEDMRAGIEWFLQEGHLLDLKGRALVESRYTWDIAGKALENALKSIDVN